MSVNKNIYLLCLITLLSCGKKVVSDTSTMEEKEDIICTEEFVSININLNSATKQPFILDTFNIILVKDNKDITNKIEQQSTNEGIYTIMNDSFKKELFNDKTELVFTGYSRNIKVVEEKYIIGADHCHVYYVSGNKEIKINH